MATQTSDPQIDALDRGHGYLDLKGWGLTGVHGADAEGWLDDLITASTRWLGTGWALRSLLLSPTGRIRADFHVLRTAAGDGFVLLQGPGQPEPIADLLAPYVLSSEVELAPAERTVPLVRPSLGSAWAATWGDPDDGAVRVGAGALETWRIRHGIARFPVDLDADSLPAEAGLDVEPVIDRAKGCYLGQESVARVRNLGHPPRVVIAVRAARPLRPGQPVFGDGVETGTVTSTEPGGGSAAMVRIRWDARDTELRAHGDILLERR